MASAHLSCLSVLFPSGLPGFSFSAMPSSLTHSLIHSISALLAHSLIQSVTHARIHSGSSWHAYTPCWAVGTAGNNPANIKPRSQARISRGRIPSALWEEERERAPPTRPGAARCFFRGAQPKQSGQKERGQGHGEQFWEPWRVRCKL